MTKQDIQQLIRTLIFSMVLYLLLKDVVFALSLPLGLYLFSFLASRAFGASWLVHQDEEEATFRKPIALRTFFGVMALASAGLIPAWIHFCLPGNGKADASMGVFGLVVLVLITLLFLWGSGPMDTRFDLRRGRILYRVGPPLLSRQIARDKSEAVALRVIVTRRRGSVMYVRWKGRGRRSGTCAQFETGEEAQAMAERLGRQLGLPVELRQVNTT